MSRQTESRRRFLRGAAGVTIGLPYLESAFLSRASITNALAQVAPKSRFLTFFTPNGTNNHQKFMPQGLGADFTLGEETAPLLPFRHKLLALSGVDMKSATDAHVGRLDQHSIGMGHLLTGTSYVADPTLEATPADNPAVEGNDLFQVGFAGGISVDQELAARIGGDSKFRSLQFGVQTSVRYGNHPFSRMCYAGPSQPLSPEDSPLAAFTRLFGSTLPATPPGLVEAQLKDRLSVLDFVIEDYSQVLATIPSSDRQRLDQHLTNLRELERSLRVGTGVTAASCSSIAIEPVGDPNLHANFPSVARQQADLLVLALSCGLTRVASLQLSYARSLETLEWISTAGCQLCEPTLSEDHHGLSHQSGATSSARIGLINRWYSAELAYLLQKMEAVDEGASTLLDNSLVFYCTDVSHGATHEYENIRAFLFGGAGGTINSGRHLQFAGEPHNKLLVTLLNAMGVNATTFGDPSYGSGPLSGILNG